MSANKIEVICSCCGAKNVEYRHTLSKSLVVALRIFARTSAGGARILRGSGLNHSQVANFQKLRYWGLVDKLENNMWQVTDYGKRFIDGEMKAFKHVWTFRGERERYENDKGTIYDAMGGWKTRVQYAQEAKPHF